MLSMLMSRSARTVAMSRSTPLRSATAIVRRVLPLSSPMTVTNARKISVEEMMPTTLPTSERTGIPPIFSRAMTSAASSIVVVSVTVMTFFCMTSATLIFESRVRISKRSSVVAAEGEARRRSRFVKKPTSFPCSTTGRRRKCPLSMIFAASSIPTSGAMVMGFLVMQLATNIMLLLARVNLYITVIFAL